MKFSAYKNDLANALSTALIAAAVKPMTPILAGVLIIANNNSVELRCTDNFKTVRVKIPANVEVEGSTAVDAKHFQAFVKNLPDDTLTCHIEDKYLIIESGGATVELLTVNPADFPKTKQIAEPVCSVDISPTDLKAALTKTIFAVAKDETRPIFTGVLFEFSGDKLNLVASNTHRIARQAVKLNDSFEPNQFVIPPDILRGLLSNINNDTDNVQINFSTQQAEFFFDNILIITRLIEGQFPPYDKVLNCDTPTLAKIDVKTFRDALNFIALMAKETEYNTVKLSFANGGVEIRAASDFVGESTVNVEAEIDGEDVSIAFNVTYLLDVLKVIDSQEVNIGLKEKHAPAKFTAPGDDRYIYVATPVRA